MTIIINYKGDPEAPIVKYEYDDDDDTMTDNVVEGDIMVTPDDGRFSSAPITDRDRSGKSC